MDKTKKQVNLKLLSKPITVAVDGHSINITDRDIADLLFFQVSQQVGEILEANGVASIRMTLSQLKEFKDILTKIIAEHEAKKKQK